MASRCIFGKILGFFVLTLCSAAAAETTSVTEAQLAEHLRLYSTIKTLEADFHQVKDLRELGMQMKSEGRLTLRRPDAVTWEVRKPARVKVELDPNGMRITSGEGKTATVQTFSTAQMGASMSGDKDASSLRDLVAWLKLDAHALAEQYAIATTGGNRFFFTPKKPGPIASMEMELAKAGHLSKLVLNESSGDRMTLEFSRPKIVKGAP